MKVNYSDANMKIQPKYNLGAAKNTTKCNLNQEKKATN